MVGGATVVVESAEACSAEEEGPAIDGNVGGVYVGGRSMGGGACRRRTR